MAGRRKRIGRRSGAVGRLISRIVNALQTPLAYIFRLATRALEIAWAFERDLGSAMAKSWFENPARRIVDDAKSRCLTGSQRLTLPLTRALNLWCAAGCASAVPADSQPRRSNLYNSDSVTSFENTHFSRIAETCGAVRHQSVSKT